MPFKHLSGHEKQKQLMKTIYLVEDNVAISQMVYILLAGKGFSVCSSGTVAAFRRQMAKGVPEMFILDIMLPDGNGIDLCRELKSDPQTSAIPVILMSAHMDVKEKALEAGADDFVNKPFDIKAFTGMVQTLSAG